MCRLLGVVSSESTDFRVSLRDAPRSLATLSREHPHGWGIAVHDSESGWTLHKQATCAGDDDRFAEVVSTTRGDLLLAHIRKRTVGPTVHANTHPFRRERWVFAHNGTVQDQAYLRSRTSASRLAEIEGETDSELLFAFLLSRLDAARASDRAATEDTDEILLDATQEMTSRPGFGSCNFFLSDGRTLYAHRSGRTLYLLERGPHLAGAGNGAHAKRRRALLVASERITDEEWIAIPDGTLVRADRDPEPRWVALTPDL